MKSYEVKHNDNPKIKEHKYKSLMCINEKDMAKLRKNKEAKIVGVIDLSNHKDNPYAKTSNLKVQNDNSIIYYKVNPVYKVNNLIKFVYVGNQEYLGIARKDTKLVAILLLLIISVLCGSTYVYVDANTNDSNEVINPRDVEEEVQVEPYNYSYDKLEEVISMPGYSDLVITSQYRNLILSNPNSNVYLEYTLCVDNKVMYETKSIKPSKAVEVNLYDILGVGDYVLEIQIKSYDVETWVECNGTSQKVDVTVKP